MQKSENFHGAASALPLGVPGRQETLPVVWATAAREMADLVKNGSDEALVQSRAKIADLCRIAEEAAHLLSVLGRIARKVPDLVPRDEAADMACEFVIEARHAVTHAKGGR